MQIKIMSQNSSDLFNIAFSIADTLMHMVTCFTAVYSAQVLCYTFNQ